MALGDLYALLDADRGASDPELKWAYERELNKAHKMNAFKHAQEIDAAYAILRDPQRRAMYDSHGITDPHVRDSPLTRPSAVAGTSSYRPLSAIGDVGPVRSHPGINRGRRVKIWTGVAVIAIGIGLGAWIQSNAGSSNNHSVLPTSQHHHRHHH